MDRLRQLGAILLLFLVSPAPAQEGRFLGKTAAHWLADLTHPDSTLRRSAAFALSQLGEHGASAAPALFRLLRDPDPSVRAEAAQALGGLRRSVWVQVVDALRERLSEDDDPRVRRSAAFALGNLAEAISSGNAEIRGPVQEALVRALQDAEPAVRQNAAWALGEFGDNPPTVAIERLIELLHDADELVRRDVASALGTLRPPIRVAVRPLFNLLQIDPEVVVRQAALTSLVNVVDPADTFVVHALRALVNEEDAELARPAALALANIGGVEAAVAVPLLCRMLEEPGVDTRRLAAAALLRIGPPAAEAVLTLARALDDGDAPVRRAAALALGRIGAQSSAALPQILARLDGEKEEEVRASLVEALAVMSPAIEPAVPSLRRLARADPNADVRIKAVLALGRLPDLGGRETIPLLETLLSEAAPGSRLLRYNTAVVLALHRGAEASEKTLDTLLALMEDKQIQIYGGADASVRSGGAEAQAGESTVRRKYTGDGRTLAAQALGQVGPRANRPAILRALESLARETEGEPREAARTAQARITGKQVP